MLLEPRGLNIGSVNEDFAVESIAGDVFQLGNTSYRILRVESGKVRVEDAQGCRRPFRSGSAKRRGAVMNCRRPSRACKRSWTNCSAPAPGICNRRSTG